MTLLRYTMETIQGLAHFGFEDIDDDIKKNTFFHRNIIPPFNQKTTFSFFKDHFVGVDYHIFQEISKDISDKYSINILEGGKEMNVKNTDAMPVWITIPTLKENESKRNSSTQYKFVFETILNYNLYMEFIRPPIVNTTIAYNKKHLNYLLQIPETFDIIQAF